MSTGRRVTRSISRSATIPKVPFDEPPPVSFAKKEACDSSDEPPPDCGLRGDQLPRGKFSKGLSKRMYPFLATIRSFFQVPDDVEFWIPQMCLSYTNIHFDYDGHYSKSEDNYEWIPIDARLYAISFRTSSLEEITYLLLKERICRKIGIDPFTKRLNLGYIPLVVEPKRQSYILYDEDVFVYLTSMDKEQRRSILHVEDIRELEIVQITEHLSRVEKESSYSRNCGERESGYGEEENLGTGLEQREHNEHPHKKHKRSRL
ncbi:hypothetical protein N665_0618s0003 [Sinapis alba]|nr:hypothetical protein N665_0618s0003 [Sinapis alba]